QEKLVINEIMYNPRIASADYIEILNTSAASAFDLTGYRLDGVDFDFEDGAVIEPSGYLVIAKNKAVFADTYGRTIPVAGEFSGSLDKGGETITLLHSNLIIDEVTYDDVAPWPSAADGTGPSLQLVDAAQDNDRVANWGAVASGSTNPPQTLLRITNAWRFNQTADLSGVNWMASTYNDSAWPSGPALLYAEDAALPAPKSTPLTLGRLTYYFRTHFNLSGSPAGASLKINTVLDDGAVFYLNGEEIFRLAMNPGTVSYGTLANRGIGDAVFEGPFLVPGNALRSGDNVLAVEVHQNGSGSSDIVFGMTLETTYDVLSLYTPGVANSVRATLPAFPPLWLNEVQPNNFFLGTNGLMDRFGDRDPWVELFNGSTNPISLNGYALATNFTNLAQWPFPAGASIGPGQFLVVWVDGEPGESISTELHTSFRVATNGGSVVLSRTNQIVDYLTYDIPNLGRSYGSYPDGRVSGRRTFHFVTPGRTNNPSAAPVNVFINEWMAANSGFEPDPADGNFEDWFELYNASPFDADLSDYYLTDALTNRTKWRIPDGTIIPPNGFLLVWADEETEQNGFTNQLHANFRLSQTGEEIGLYAPDGTPIDTVIFGDQTNNVSQGRYPDGGASIITLAPPTPGEPNAAITSNSPPVLAAIGDRAIPESTQLLVTCAASDAESPPQTLRFNLAPGYPAGATIDILSGQFSWTPSEAQGPGVYDITVRVTDNGTPNMSDSKTFTVIVSEVNNAPTLEPLGNRTISESNTLTVAVSASDPDAGQTLTFSLDPGAPAGMTIHATNGTITWTPGEAFGGGNYSAVVRATDNGQPPLSGSTTLALFVNEINIPPVLGALPNKTIHAGMRYQVTAAGADGDLPPQQLTYILDDFGTTGATIDAASGVFSWTPTLPNTTNTFQIKVADNGVPVYQSAPVMFTLIVGAELRITEVSREPSGVVLRWHAVPGSQYQLEHKDQLQDAEWAPLGQPQTAPARFLEATDASPLPPQRFYRVRLLSN
ncbi:MAG TPA: lamin tail domain-containing protein, partial [Verrucomicrobiae bacterium]|nr:lamin tail domain-containing protein [Verrucomicrobiae bacterium]